MSGSLSRWRAWRSPPNPRRDLSETYGEIQARDRKLITYGGGTAAANKIYKTRRMTIRAASRANEAYEGKRGRAPDAW